jgi:hypothetical protein
VIKTVLQQALQNSARDKKNSARGILRYPVR